MAVSSKGKRQLVVDDRKFFWFVTEDPDTIPETVDHTDMRILNIVSEDKQFFVRYYLGQKAERGLRHLTILGHEFVGADYSGSWRRFECPHWCPEGVVKPRDVRTIIDWCFDNSQVRIKVDYKGQR